MVGHGGRSAGVGSTTALEQGSVVTVENKPQKQIKVARITLATNQESSVQSEESNIHKVGIKKQENELTHKFEIVG